MTTLTLLGCLLVLLSGLGTGSCAWPMKVVRRFQFEHSWFVGMLVGLILLPWGVTLLFGPNAVAAYRSVDPVVLLKSNLFSVSWGIANVLYGICVVRIGMALTGAILSGLGVCVGVTLPMILKGSGLFHQAPDLGSPAGRMILVGIAVMLIGVVFVSLAGLGRDRALAKMQQKTGGFVGGLIMSIIAGVLSCGAALAFVYSQGPVVEAMKAQGAGEVVSNLAVWAVGLLGGALVNIGYPAYLMTRNKSWNVLTENWREVMLAAIIGIQFITAMALLGKGMVWLGILGASVGFGIQQAMQILGNLGVGFVSGEWRGVYGTPRRTMTASIAVLLVATVIMAYSNRLA